MADCCCSWMRLLTCGEGLVVPEEAVFVRGRVYHPILYEWGGGRPAFGGRGAAYSSNSSMVSPLPCGRFGVGET
jgi:hypothetical protein